MNLTKHILTAALAITTTLGVLPATAAQAQPGYSYRDDHRRSWDRDRDGIPNRYDRYNDNRRYRDRDRDGIPNRYDRYDNRRNWGYHGGYRYGDNRRCWTQWQRGWRGERIPVRVCR